MSSPAQPTVGRSVDWALAGSLGARLSRPGPPVSDYTRRQVVAELAEASRTAEDPVRDVTGLSVEAPVPDASIVDRADWVRAASESMRVMTGGDQTGAGESAVNPLTGRIAGAQTAAVLAFVSTGILGQYDPFAGGGGRLLLVYPNVVAVERQLRVAPRDFRLWVCLHEVTHRVQFTANPWLAEHMSSSLAVLTSGRDEELGRVIGRLAQFVRDRREATGGDPGILGLLRAVQSDPQREALDQLLMLGTLLEGHADYVMDAVGPAVVPSVDAIRRRFNDRRGRRHPPLQRLLRALLGVDAKLSQYTRGRAFVDYVVNAVGMERFNVVWSGPGALPRPDEIESPQRWIDRVL